MNMKLMLLGCLLMAGCATQKPFQANCVTGKRLVPAQEECITTRFYPYYEIREIPAHAYFEVCGVTADGEWRYERHAIPVRLLPLVQVGFPWQPPEGCY